jgi:5-methylthioribose kinase
MQQDNRTIKSEFQRQHPGIYLLDCEKQETMLEFLKGRRWIAPSEGVLTAECAGEGNMNCTVRVRTETRSFILKQARPWVEKYPTIPAPWDRSVVEAQFYELVSTQPALRAQMPRFLAYDPECHLLMLEDLGAVHDFTFLYREETLDFEELEALIRYLVQLHGDFCDSERKKDFANREMRTLNHYHMFVFPLLTENNIRLDAITPGLKDSANRLLTDVRYQETVTQLGEAYLEDDGDCLLHGDYFPGSWLKTDDGIRIIDPEFCFYGPAEFEIGVLVAHLYLARQQESLIQDAVTRYASQRRLNERTVRQYAGVEIMRRLIGVAQLPLPYGLEEKEKLLSLSRRLVMV